MSRLTVSSERVPTLLPRTLNSRTISSRRSRFSNICTRTNSFGLVAAESRPVKALTYKTGGAPGRADVAAGSVPVPATAPGYPPRQAQGALCLVPCACEVRGARRMVANREPEPRAARASGASNQVKVIHQTPGINLCRAVGTSRRRSPFSWRQDRWIVTATLHVSRLTRRMTPSASSNTR